MRTHATRARTATLSKSGESERAGGCGGSCGGGCASCSGAELLSPMIGPGFSFGRTRLSPDREPPATMLAETDDGVELASPGSETLVDGGAPNAPVAAGSGCSSGISGGSFTTIPSAQTIVAAFTGNKLGAVFQMVGTFTPSTAGCSSTCGEYRQYVKGSLMRNGAPIPYQTCSGPLSATTYQEDCVVQGGQTYKYGYHSLPFQTSTFDNPDQATGLTFHGYDAPGVRGRSGDTVSIQADFRGELVDTCNGNTVLQSAEWSVAGSGTVP